MHRRGNRTIRGLKELRKKKNKKENLKNVISLRINDDEKTRLERLTKATSKNISDIMREAFELWAYQRNRLCTD